jgi:cellulose synthase/poly-beta-1,6-N-acetylglucosamine synthase-like glycosyltransferase
MLCRISTYHIALFSLQLRLLHLLPALLHHSYGVLVLLIEIISSTATFGYAVLLIKYSKSRRTKGLPIPKKGQQPDLDNLKFHVRVLIPCYKESVDLVKLTVLGALKAPLPKDTLRTVYLCDDGKDPAKEEMVRELNNEWGCLEYVSGRKRDPNGESSCCGSSWWLGQLTV